VGIIGCGLIAQLMHLHHLRLLRDRFELVALCDLAPGLLDEIGREQGVERLHARYETLLREDLDAVLVLTSGSHAPPVLAALRAGLHVFVEKPLCLTPAEGEAIVAAAEESDRILMVGYHKRYDPAYERALEELERLSRPVLVRVTTLEGPLEPTIAPFGIRRPEPLEPGLAAALAGADAALVAEALPDGDEVVRRVYREFLLDSMVHELNAIRGLLGDPVEVRHASIRRDGQGIVAALALPDEVDCVATWSSVPGLDRYEQQIAVYAPERRITLTFPSPFVRNLPTRLDIEAGDERGATWRQTVTASWDSAYRRELEHFHACATTGQPPRTTAADGLADVRLVHEIALAAAAREHPVEAATALR
jgi:predicted dehydrogenase